MKPIILFFPYELMSHYLRSITLAKSLANDYDIYFAHSHKYAPFLKKSGFKTFTCEQISPDEIIESAKRFDFSWINRKNLERVFLSQVAAIEKYLPVAVVGDTSFTLGMAAEYMQTPYTSIINGYMSNHYLFQRSLSQSHPRYHDFMRLPRVIQPSFLQAAEQLNMRLVHKPFREMRKNYGLSSKTEYLSELEGDLTLIADSEDVFPQKRLPKGYKILGPIFYDDDKNESLLAVDPQKPTVFISMGSSGSIDKVSAFNDEMFSCYNIIVAGDNSKTLNSPHIIHTPFLSSNEIGRWADVVVCHGGNGSLYQAVMLGKHVMAFPAFFEQEWNAVRFSQLGLCHTYFKPLDADALMSELERMLNTQNAALSKFTESFQRAQPQNVFCNAITQLLGERALESA
jgi:UDP:flavonoid glycosyltransferase YjiC (YdhE family)